MKLTVIGKYGPYPAAGGGTSCYLVRGENDAVVLDFGSGALAKLQRHIAIDDVRAIILSHLHYDHMCDLLPLIYLLQARGKTMTLVLPDTDCPQRALLEKSGVFRLVSVQPQWQAGEFSLSFEKMRHPLESYAVKISARGKTLMYTGDTAFCDQLPAFAKGSNLLLADCGKAEHSAAPHLSLSEAAFLGETLHVPVIATHLNPALIYTRTSSVVTLAEEGKTYAV